MSDNEPSQPRTHARPGSRWNSSNRHPQKAYEQPKGFARGCRVNQSTVRKDTKPTLENKP